MLLSSPSPPRSRKVLLGGVSWDTASRAGTQEGADLVLALWTSCQYPGTPEGLRQPQQPPPCCPCSPTHAPRRPEIGFLSLLQLLNDEQCLQLLRAPNHPTNQKTPQTSTSKHHKFLLGFLKDPERSSSWMILGVETSQKGEHPKASSTAGCLPSSRKSLELEGQET